jgi:hypothetical protein
VNVSNISRPDIIDQKTICTITVIDAAGTAFYERGQPVLITDSILGTVFTGVVHSPQMTLLYPSVEKTWVIDCVQRGDYLSGKRTSNRSYANQYGGTIVVDQIQRYGEEEGLAANAALRWDEAQGDWTSGTLANTVATVNASNGNVGAGDLELSLAGASINSSNPGSGFSVQNGLMLTGYASSGYSTAYVYRQIWTGSITVVANDYIEFDVWIRSDSPQIMASVNLTCSDGTTLNISGGTDNQGMSMNLKTDLSGLANDQWYTRYSFLPSGFVGKTVTSIEVALGGVNAGTYTAYFRRIIYGHYTAGTIVTIFGDTSTLAVNNQTLNNGYSNVSLTQVSVKDKVAQTVLGPISIGGVNIVKNSQMSYDTLVPSGATALVETSIDGGASWQAQTSGDPIPNLLPGMSVAGRSLYYRHTLTQGTDPTLAMGIGSMNLVINSSYNTTKSDVITAYTTATDYALGTLTNLKTVGATTAQGVTVNGLQANWGGVAPTATAYGSGNNVLQNKQMVLNTLTGFDFRLRMDFAGQWANFTTEVDITVPSGSATSGIVYRTTGWQAANNTYAYAVNVGTTSFQLARGSNTATGAGAFTSIVSVTVALTANSVHRIKAVVSGTSHQIYLDGVLLINTTDTTYTAAGYIGLRSYNSSGATVATPYDNFGVCSALSGTWQSPAIPLAGASLYGNSVVSWDIDGIPDSTCSITAQTSLDAGATWQAATNGGPISGLTAGASLTGKSLLIRMTLTASNAPVVPTLNGLSVWIMGAYSASGTRVSTALSLAAVTRAASALVNWNANTPTNTSLAVATSIDGGATYQSVSTPGGAITGISVQPDPNEDTFSVNSSADYTQSNFGWTTGTWTWDTANSRLVGSGGVNGTLTLLAALTFADNQVQGVFDQADGSGLLANYTASTSGYYVCIYDASGTSLQNQVKLFKRSASTNAQVGATATIAFTRGTPHIFKLNVSNGGITVSMDGVALIAYTDSSPLGAGLSGLLLNTLARVYSLRVQQYGQNVSTLSLLTKLTLTSTDPTATPQVLDMQAFVSSPDIWAGVLVPSVSYLRTFLSNNIADLNTKSDYWTTWKNDNTCLFQHREATAAPFVLSSLNSQVIAGQVINDVLVDSAEVDNSGDSYRNRQVMKGAIATATFTEIKVGDGSTTSWSVANPLVAPPTSIVLNGQSQTFGVKGVDTGKQYYYQIGSTSIDQDSSQTVLQGSDSFTIVYTGSFSQDVVLDNTGQFPGTISQSMMQTIENSGGGNSSGIVEAVLDLSSTPTTVAAATTQGNQLLQRFGTIGRTFKCKTLRSGFAPGQQVSIFVPECNLNNVQMLVTEVDITPTQAPGVTGGLLYAWALTLMEGPNLGTWVQLFMNMLS